MASAIQAEALGKRYRIGEAAPAARYATLREAAAHAASAGLRSLRRPSLRAPPGEPFWALRDVSFDVAEGDVVGVIGRNGAGKSTLLKILSRITEPSCGRVTVNGRVASLLEVGTGFHPELTGRENIFLNGAVLGMRRAELKRIFDQIVAFAEVEAFLDTPVKRYSTGMYVRLAFAVAAHVQSEILLVDEVLAVGDLEFQRKCLGRIRAEASGGRTVLFISHDMAAISTLCPRCMLLDHGRLVTRGDTADVIEAYTRAAAPSHRVRFDGDDPRPRITDVCVDAEALRRGDLDVRISFSSPYPLATPVGGVSLRAASGQAVWGSNARIHPGAEPGVSAAVGQLRCVARALPLRAAEYTLSVWLASWHEDLDHRPDVLRLALRPGETRASAPSSEVIGHLDWEAQWSLARDTE